MTTADVASHVWPTWHVADTRVRALPQEVGKVVGS